jgi:hypothetical protein
MEMLIFKVGREVDGKFRKGSAEGFGGTFFFGADPTFAGAVCRYRICSGEEKQSDEG